MIHLIAFIDNFLNCNILKLKFVFKHERKVKSYSTSLLLYSSRATQQTLAFFCEQRFRVVY